MDISAIDVDRVIRSFQTDGGSVVALDGVSLTVPRGEMLAIMGPSGSGKSTLLYLMGALDRPTSGTVTLGGQDLSRLSPDALAGVRSRHVGFVFQGYNLHPALTVLENVLLPAMLATSRVGTARRQRALGLLDELGLAAVATRFPAQLSGGQQQRAALARALVQDPTVILADEPTGNLDTRTGDDVLELLAGYHARGQTIVIVTHDAKVAGRADRVVHIQDGNLTESAVPVPSASHRIHIDVDD